MRGDNQQLLLPANECNSPINRNHRQYFRVPQDTHLVTILIWHKGQLIAVIPVEQFFEMTLDDGRLLHVGPFGIFFKQPIIPDDQIKIVIK